MDFESANYATGYGYDLISSGQNETMLCGGTDAFSRVAFTGFNRLLAMAPEKCQPFDKNRKGMMLGEGAGILVLESLDHAMIYSEAQQAKTGYKNVVDIVQNLRNKFAESNTPNYFIDYFLNCVKADGEKQELNKIESNS